MEDGELMWKSKLSDAEKEKQTVITSFTDAGFAWLFSTLQFKCDSSTGSGSGEGPGGDNKCGKTGHQSGSCLHL